MMEELKACPFCGSTDIQGPHENDYGWWVCCKNDNCPHEGVACIDTEKDAIEVWNTRQSIQISEVEKVIEDLSKAWLKDGNSYMYGGAKYAINKLKQLINHGL
jgi:hypothetical protein